MYKKQQANSTVLYLPFLSIHIFPCTEVKWEMLGNYSEIYPLSLLFLLVDFIGHSPTSSNS